MDISLEDQRGPTKEWISSDIIKQRIARKFKQFLLNFRDENGEEVYQGRLAEMCSCRVPWTA